MLCEDYPCCGHENMSCNDTTDYRELYLERMMRDDYDPYYDDMDY